MIFSVIGSVFASPIRFRTPIAAVFAKNVILRPLGLVCESLVYLPPTSWVAVERKAQAAKAAKASQSKQQKQAEASRSKQSNK